MTISRNRFRGLQFESLEGRRLLAADLGVFHNMDNPEDVNNDGSINVTDAFIAIGEIRTGGGGEIRKLADVDADGRVSFKDALHIIARLRNGGETTAPLEQRISNLTNAIENGSLPEQLPVAQAEQLLDRLVNRFESIGEEFSEDPLSVVERLARRFDRVDLDGDGRLSDTEIQGEGEGMVQALDDAPRNDGGVISDDFIAALRERFEELADRIENPTDAFAVFDFLDTDDSGGLTEDESPTPEVWNALSPGDANGDESLTEEELVDYGRDLLEEQVDRLFGILDASNDGYVTQNDVAPLVWFFLRRADENLDDALSIDEFRAIPLGILDRLNGQD